MIKVNQNIRKSRFSVFVLPLVNFLFSLGKESEFTGIRWKGFMPQEEVRGAAWQCACV